MVFPGRRYKLSSRQCGRVIKKKKRRNPVIEKAINVFHGLCFEQVIYILSCEKSCTASDEALTHLFSLQPLPLWILHVVYTLANNILTHYVADSFFEGGNTHSCTHSSYGFGRRANLAASDCLHTRMIPFFLSFPFLNLTSNSVL